MTVIYARDYSASIAWFTALTLTCKPYKLAGVGSMYSLFTSYIVNKLKLWGTTYNFRFEECLLDEFNDVVVLVPLDLLLDVGWVLHFPN